MRGQVPLLSCRWLHAGMKSWALSWLQVAPDGAGYLWRAEGIAPGTRGELLLVSGAGVAEALEGWVPQVGGWGCWLLGC